MKKYRTAVIGVGFVGVVHIEALRRLGNVDVIAICDANSVEKKAKELFIENTYTDYKKMIDEQNLDFIHICTPNNTHYEIAKYAIRNNVNILLEKPMTFTSDEAKELSELISEKGLIGVVNFHNRLYPACAFMKDMIHKDDIGEIISVNGMYVQDWLLYDTDYSWRLNKEESGSTRTIADIGSHWIDLVEYITGQHVKSVMADFKTVFPVRKKAVGNVESFSTILADEFSEYPIETEDIATLLFRLENGAIGSALFSQMVAGKKNQIELLISGKKASVEWKLDSHEDVMIGYRNKPSELLKKDFLLMNNVSNMFNLPAGHTEGYADAIKQVFKDVYNNDGKRSYATFHDGYRQMLINEKIYESALRNVWVDIKE
jgi:predicted dehydrogenase